MMLWQSEEYDFPVELTGVEMIDEDTGRVYCEVIFENNVSFVPKDELLWIED